MTKWLLSAEQPATTQSALFSRHSVEREIERQHVHAGLAEKSERAAFGMLIHELAQAIFGHIAGLGNPGHLEQGGLRRDVRVEAAARGGDQVDRYGSRRVFLFQLLD